MPQFSARSAANLAECAPDLRRVFEEVIKHWDCTILDGARTMAEQVENVKQHVSQTLNSKHLQQADGFSHAVDVLPYPFDWVKLEQGMSALKAADATMYAAEVYAFIGFVKGVACMLGVDLRQGVDWNSNNQFDDQHFDDLPHHELR